MQGLAAPVPVGCGAKPRFAEAGGVARIIGEKRLDRSYRDVMLSRTAHRAIPELAYRYGFASSRRFLGSFRARFGVSPGDVADEGVSPVLANQRLADLHANFAVYAKQLRAARRKAIPDVPPT